MAHHGRDRCDPDGGPGVLAGSGRPLVVTSGTGLLPPGRLGTEQDESDTTPFAALRGASEAVALAFAGRGVRASVLRLPFSVHGTGDRGFVPALIGFARAAGMSAYPGDGANRWPAVHRLDAANLFRLAVEAAPAGARLHAVADEGVPVRDIGCYVHGLENWLIRALDRFGVRGERRPGRIGIWVVDPGTGAEAKIAAIGVRVTRWVSWHGVALNVAPDLSHFSGIVPCGIREHGVTSLAALGIPATLAEADAALRDAWEQVFGRDAVVGPACEPAPGAPSPAPPV